jgi:hypothetical protein
MAVQRCNGVDDQQARVADRLDAPGAEPVHTRVLPPGRVEHRLQAVDELPVAGFVELSAGQRWRLRRRARRRRSRRLDGRVEPSSSSRGDDQNHADGHRRAGAEPQTQARSA